MNNMNDSVSSDVRRIASDILGVPARELSDESSPETVDTWDSITHLNLIMALEQALNIGFDPEEIERMRSIRAIESVIRSKRGA